MLGRYRWLTSNYKIGWILLTIPMFVLRYGLLLQENLLLKGEQANMGGNWEQLQPINVANQWVELCFDGSQPDAATGGANAHGRTFGAVVLFFDFACGTGIPDPPSADKTWFFDDIIMSGPAPSINEYL